jgi:hypothetical protein
MTQLPREARDGIMRAWLQILRERHPDVSWVVGSDGPEDDPPCNAETSSVLVAG